MLGILAFTLFGPLVWTVAPGDQDLDQISTPPTLGATASIVAPYVPATPIVAGAVPALPPGGTPGAPANVEVIGTATTQAVRLAWQPVAGADLDVIEQQAGAGVDLAGREQPPGGPEFEPLPAQGFGEQPVLPQARKFCRRQPPATRIPVHARYPAPAMPGLNAL